MKSFEQIIVKKDKQELKATTVGSEEYGSIGAPIAGMFARSLSTNKWQKNYL